MSTNTDEYQYYVLQLPELPHCGIVSVPSSWIIERSSKNVIVKYPVEASSLTNQRVEKNEEYKVGWNIYSGKIVYRNDNYVDILGFCTRYMNLKSKQRNSLQNREDSQSTSSRASKENIIHDQESNSHITVQHEIQQESNFTEEAQTSGYNTDIQTPTTSKRYLQDEHPKKKLKKSVLKKASTPCDDENSSVGIASEKNTGHDLFPDLPGTYTLLYQNLKVTKQKLHEITSCTSKIPFNILCLTETGLKGNKHILDNFRVVSASNKSNSGKGGSMVLVKSDISAAERKDVVDLSVDGVCDISCVEFEHHVVICFYRYVFHPLYVGSHNYLSSLDRALKIVLSTDKYIIISGNFDPYIITTSSIRHLSSYFQELNDRYGMVCISNSSIRDRSSSLKRNIFVDFEPVIHVDLTPAHKFDWCRGAVCINYSDC